MWNCHELEYSSNITTRCIVNEEKSIDYENKYEVKSNGKIKKYSEKNILKLDNEDDRDDNDQSRIWCIFVKHKNDYIPVFHWSEDALLNVYMSYIDVTTYQLKWNKKIDYIYKIIIRDVEEMEYSHQPATIITLLIFNNNTYQILENSSLDAEFNPNYANSRPKSDNCPYVLFELSYNNYDENEIEYFNIVGFGDNRMLCICNKYNLKNNTEVKIDGESEMYDILENEGDYDYDDYNEILIQT